MGRRHDGYAVTTLGWLAHELVLRHGSATTEFSAHTRSRKYGVVIKCPCGKRWLGRAPWFRGAS